MERHRCKARIAVISADPKMIRRRPNQQQHCSLCRRRQRQDHEDIGADQGGA
jgi:hypothetical protein